MNDDQSTTQTPAQPPIAIDELADRSESEIVPIILVHCHSRGIKVRQSPTPNLAELLEAVSLHLQAHRSRPFNEFAGGDKEWRSIQNDLAALSSSIEKILLRKICNRLTPKSELGCEQDAQTEQLAGGHPSGHPTGHPPVYGRSTPGQSTDADRSTDDQDPDEADLDDEDLEDENLDDEDLDDEDEEVKKARAEYLAQLLRERTSRSPLDDLSAERQKTLFELLSEHPTTIVLEMVTQRPPLGWGLKTSRPSLDRFFERYRKQHRKAEIAEAADEAEKIAKDPAATPQTFAEATRRLIQLRLFQTAKDPASDTEEIEFLCRYLDRQRRTDLSERRVQINEQKSTEKE